MRRPTTTSAPHFTALGRPEEAELCCREALRLKPGYAAALTNLGDALALQKKLSDAAARFGHAAALKPDDVDALFSGFHIKQTICDWSGYGEYQARVRNGVRAQAFQAVPSAAFRLLGCTSTQEEQFAFAQRVAARTAVPEPATLASRLPRPGERIRLGYLYANFHIHPVADLIAGLIEHRDRRCFEIIGYAFDEDDGSTMRRRLASAFDRFVDISEMQDRDAARLIRVDTIDVLIDLHGFTPDCRAKILAYRPSIQVNYLGIPARWGRSLSTTLSSIGLWYRRISDPSSASD
jgi:protein O-GlcNAc transferase